jgi:hypothetical protein
MRSCPVTVGGTTVSESEVRDVLDRCNYRTSSRRSCPDISYYPRNIGPQCRASPPSPLRAVREQAIQIHHHVARSRILPRITRCMACSSTGMGLQARMVHRPTHSSYSRRMVRSRPCSYSPAQPEQRTDVEVDRLSVRCRCRLRRSVFQRPNPSRLPPSPHRRRHSTSPPSSDSVVAAVFLEAT